MKRILSKCLSLIWVAVLFPAMPCCVADGEDALSVESLLTNRAYSGAPPTVPHEVEQLGRAECLECHRQGDAVGESARKASISPHPELIFCAQCHVQKNADGLFLRNDFIGHTYRLGLRGQPLGPLLVPHPFTMREDCLACHGPNARLAGLKTTHPKRQHCVQCHLPAFEGFPGPRPPTDSGFAISSRWELENRNKRHVD